MEMSQAYKATQKMIRIDSLKHCRGIYRLLRRNMPEYPQDDPRPSNWLLILFGIAIFLCVIFLLTGCAHAYTASWYGTTGDHTDPFNHVWMANGHKFNENAMTAASWMYPMGTRVRITNLRNGKHIIVKITDRGPGRHLYRSGRIVDLTRGAFKRLSSLDTGVIHISIRKV